MPYGLCNSPSTQSRLMQLVLAGLEWYNCLVYVDDTICYSKTFSDHLLDLAQVFDRFRLNHHCLKPAKCQFACTTTKFLGHIILAEGLRPDPAKVECVVNCPVPDNLATLEYFLGLTGYYRKFMCRYSDLAQPLNGLKKKEKFIWTPPCQEAFEILKEKLVTAPVLRYPDFSLPYLVHTDASGYAVGATLSQQCPEETKEHPLSYASRTMTKAETRYPIIEKEALAVIFAVKIFRPYLYGHPFIIYTDHAPLKWLLTTANPSSRITRWSLLLREFDQCQIEYRPGKQHKNVDALSRLPLAPPAEKDLDPTEELPLLPVFVMQPVSDDDSLKNINVGQEQRIDLALAPLIRYLERDQLPPQYVQAKAVLQFAPNFCLFAGRLYYSVMDR